MIAHTQHTATLFLFAMAIAFGLASCAKEQKNDAQYTGEIYRLECFSRFGIKTSSATDSVLFVIPDDKLPSQFEQVGIRVQFDVDGMRPNTLQPQFPDPSFDPSTLYQGEVNNIKRLD